MKKKENSETNCCRNTKQMQLYQTRKQRIAIS